MRRPRRRRQPRGPIDHLGREIGQRGCFGTDCGIEQTLIDSDLVGRETELAAVGEFLRSSHAFPGALVFEGEAGIGKTTLWRSGIAMAARAGFRLLEARPVGPSLRSPSPRSATCSERSSTTSSRRFPFRSAAHWRWRCCSASTTDPRRIDAPLPSACSVCCEPSGPSDRWCWPSTTCTGSTPPRPARSSSRFGDSATSRSPCSPRTGSPTPGSGSVSGLRRFSCATG